MPWRIASPQEGEDVRWERTDGRWVSVARGRGRSKGWIFVIDSEGRCMRAVGPEAALELARKWRMTAT